MNTKTLTSNSPSAYGILYAGPMARRDASGNLVLAVNAHSNRVGISVADMRSLEAEGAIEILEIRYPSSTVIDFGQAYVTYRIVE